MISWIKRNKVVTLLIVILLIFIGKDFFFNRATKINKEIKQWQYPIDYETYDIDKMTEAVRLQAKTGNLVDTVFRFRSSTIMLNKE